MAAGDDCIIVPAVFDAEVNTAFPKGYRKAVSAGHVVAQPALRMIAHADLMAKPN
jgi:hypothetical protein